MTLFKLPFTNTGKCISGLMCLSLLSGTFLSLSCGGLPISTSSDPSKYVGLLVNSNIDSNFLGGMRGEDGTSLSLYGRFNDDGSIADLQEIVFQYEDGVASLQLDSGRPSLATLPDGSTITITYGDQTGDLRLQGTVDVALASDGQTYSIPFDVDLQDTLDEVAQRVSDLTNGAIVIDTSRGEANVVADETTSRTAKSAQIRQQLGLGVLLFAAIVGVSGMVLVSSMSGMMEAASEDNQVISGTEASILAVFLPFILMGELCRMAVASFPLTIEVEITPDYLPHRQ